MKKKKFSLITKIAMSIIALGIMLLLLHFPFDIHTEVIGIVVMCIGLMMLMLKGIYNLYIKAK